MKLLALVPTWHRVPIWSRTYPSQLIVEKSNKSDHLANYLDLTFMIDSGGKLSTRLHDKRDDSHLHIVNFPFLSSNISPGPSYGVCISQLIRYARYCPHYDDFRYCHKCLVDQLLSQDYVTLWLEKSFKKNKYQNVIEKYQRSVKEMGMIHSQDNLYFTYSRMLVVFFTWIRHLDLSMLYLIASCDGCHA